MNVAIGMPAYGSIPSETHLSVINTIKGLTDARISHAYLHVPGDCIITHARSKVVKAFLKTPCDRLVWVDSDMAWTWSEFAQLLAASERFNVIAACGPTRTFPAQFRLDADELAYDRPFQVNGIGMAFMCVAREPLEILSQRAPTVKSADGDLPLVFRVDEHGPEDFQFCSDLRKIGYKVWCDPSINVGHAGMHEFRGNLAESIKAGRVRHDRLIAKLPDHK